VVNLSKHWPASYLNAWRVIGKYWAAYGGIGALARSPYLHLSIVLSAASYGYWLAPGWWDTPISVLPNMLGFTLGGFVAFVGFMDPDIRSAIAGRRPEDPHDFSPFIKANAAYVHFLLVESVALISALVAKTTHSPSAGAGLMHVISSALHISAARMGVAVRVYWAASFLTFIYALVLLVPSITTVFRISEWIDLDATMRLSQRSRSSHAGELGPRSMIDDKSRARDSAPEAAGDDGRLENAPESAGDDGRLENLKSKE